VDKEKWKNVVVDGNLVYNGAKPGIMLKEGRKTLLTSESRGKKDNGGQREG
jgi:hypothetical protein